MNRRMRLCHLGEELMPSMLQVWADMRPSTALKEEIVDFFNLQIRAHHPKGAKTADEGTAVCLFPLSGVESFCRCHLVLPFFKEALLIGQSGLSEMPGLLKNVDTGPLTVC